MTPVDATAVQDPVARVQRDGFLDGDHGGDDGTSWKSA
jgi:hypothetical protein